jgi:hypothetical protein
MAVKLVLNQCQDQSKVTCVPDGKAVSLEHEGATITGVNAICKAIASQCSPGLLGEKEEDVVQVLRLCTLLLPGEQPAHSVKSTSWQFCSWYLKTTCPARIYAFLRQGLACIFLAS